MGSLPLVCCYVDVFGNLFFDLHVGNLLAVISNLHYYQLGSPTIIIIF